MPNTAAKSGGRPRKDITSELAASIVDYMRTHSLKAGTHLPAQELADIFNVSRSPVTQALRRLADKKIVVHLPNRGFYTAMATTPATEELGLAKAGHLTAAYFRLAEDRLRGVLSDQVSENSLRQRYDLTRGELNELLDRIAHEGWAERRPGYGWQFAPVLTTPLALEQSYRLRIAIEPAAILEPTFRFSRQSAIHLREREHQLLSGEIEEMSPDVLYERGIQFHETLAAASNNPFFLDTLRRINRMRRLFTYRAMVDRRRYYDQVREHIGIIDLLINDHLEDAAHAMRTHLERVLSVLGKIRADE